MKDWEIGLDLGLRALELAFRLAEQMGAEDAAEAKRRANEALARVSAQLDERVERRRAQPGSGAPD